MKFSTVFFILYICSFVMLAQQQNRTVDLMLNLKIQEISNQKSQAYKFGENTYVNINVSAFRESEKARKVIKEYVVQSDEALGLSFEFDQVNLSSNAKLYVTNNKDTVYARPANTEKKYLTNILKGKFAKIVLEELAGSSASEFEVSRITQVYRSAFGFGDAGPCQNNVVCPIADAYKDQVDATMLIIRNGNFSCSASLINNTCKDKKPYVLTANHCLTDQNDNIDINTIDFIFNYESVTCSPSQEGPLDQVISGATLRATDVSTDFALLEMSSVPPTNYANFLAGWNRSSVQPTSTTTTHHPRTDVKKISFDDDAPLFFNSNFWKIESWDNGTTEPGSSGGPLFDQNKRIVGELKGGSSLCSNDSSDFFVRFDVIWDLFPEPERQLKHWLDACQTGEVFIDGLHIDSLLDSNSNALCDLATPIYCGDSIVQSSISGSSSFEHYQCYGSTINLPGAEKIFKFTADSIGSIAVLLTDLNQNEQANLDVFIVDDCQSDTLDCFGSLGDTALFDVLLGQEYFIIVDGYSTGTNNTDFILQLACSWNYSSQTSDSCINGEQVDVQVQNESVSGAADGSAMASTMNVPAGESITYQWSTGSGLNAITNLSAGEYFVTMSVGYGCEIIQSVIVQVDSANADSCLLAVNLFASHETALGANDGAVTTTVSGAMGLVNFLWSNGATTQNIENLSSAVYAVTVQDDQQCEVIDSILVIAFDDTTCDLSIEVIVQPVSSQGSQDGSALVNALGGSPPYNYSWSNNQQAQEIENLAQGAYLVTVTDQNLCEQIGFANIGVAQSTVVEWNALNDNGLVFPNPVKQNEVLHLRSEPGLFWQVHFYNAVGQLVEIKSILNDNTVVLKTLPKGAYFAQFISKDGLSRQVVKLLVD